MSRRSMVILVALLLALGGAWLVVNKRPAVVAAVEVSSAPLVRSLQFSARISARARVDVGSTLTGRVEAVLVDEGARVRQGELLVRLDSDELQAAVVQAQASEQQAQARLQGLRATGRRSAEAALAQADSVLQAAQADWERTQALVDQGFLSAARLDEARRGLAVAGAQREQALAQRQAIAEAGTEVTQALAQSAVARASESAARARRAQAELRSPADATVLARYVEPGQIVQPGRALISLALEGPREIVAQVDERYLEQLRPDQPAEVVADAYPEQPFAAQIASISPLVDAQRGAVEVKLSLPPDAPDFLREDMTLSVTVETARRDSARVVPLQALREADGARAVVHVERDGRVVRLPVTVGLRTVTAAEILDGLNDGDRVLLGTTPAPGERVRSDTTRRAPGTGTGAGADAASALTETMGR